LNTQLKNLAVRGLWPAVFAALTVYGLWLLNGGYLHYEGAFFLSSYLDGRSLAEKVFSAHFNEWNCYQGRELSFLFGMIDAKAIALAAGIGLVNLYSATTVVALFVASLVLWNMFPRIAPKLSRNESGLIVSLMLTTPTFALSSYYYRPAKALAAMFLVLLWNELSKLLNEQKVGDEDANAISLHASLAFVFAAFMGLSDRQGSYLILVSLAVGAGLADWKARRARFAMVALLLALVTDAVWSFAIGPRLSGMVDGFMPDTFNQRVPLRYTFADTTNYVAALDIWRDQLSFFFGNWGAAVSIVCLLGIGFVFWRQTRVDGQRQSPAAGWRRLIVLVGASAMFVALFAAMYAKLTSLAWAESRRVYYWIPEIVVIAVIVAIGAGRAISAWPKVRRPLILVLGAMICTNILALPGHRDVVAGGEQHVDIAESSRVRQCMGGTNASISEFGLTAEGAQACASVRLAAFGSSGPGTVLAAAVPHPLLYCTRSGRRRP